MSLLPLLLTLLQSLESNAVVITTVMADAPTPTSTSFYARETAQGPDASLSLPTDSSERTSTIVGVVCGCFSLISFGIFALICWRMAQRVKEIKASSALAETNVITDRVAAGVANVETPKGKTPQYAFGAGVYHASHPIPGPSRKRAVSDTSSSSSSSDSTVPPSRRIPMTYPPIAISRTPSTSKSASTVQPDESYHRPRGDSQNTISDPPTYDSHVWGKAPPPSASPSPSGGTLAPGTLKIRAKLVRSSGV